MNTALNLLNSPADTAATNSGVASVDKHSDAARARASATDKPSGDSPFAAILKNESAGNKAESEKAGNSTGTDKETGAEQDEASSDAVGTVLPIGSAAETESADTTALAVSAGTGLTLALDTEADTATALVPPVESAQQPGMNAATAAGSDSTQQTLTVTALNTSSTITDAEPADTATVHADRTAAATVAPSAAPGAPAEPGAASGEPPRPLVITRIHQGQVFSQSESFTAAGKTLPPDGNNLPAGIFFNSEGSNETELRFSASTGSNQAIADSTRGPGKQANGLGVEFNADHLLRGLVTGKATPAAMSPDLAPLAAQPASTAGTASTETTAPPLLNPTLQVSADKALVGNRGPLFPGLEASAQFTITAEAGSSEWGNQLSSRIRWMGNLNLSSAELKLHPAELGTVEIQISTEDDQTRVSFVTSNAAAKEIIEASLPRLKDLLGEGGLQLQQGDVAHRESSDSKAGGNAEDASPPGGDDERAPEESMLHVSRKSTSQVDHYV